MRFVITHNSVQHWRNNGRVVNYPKNDSTKLIVESLAVVYGLTCQKCQGITMYTLFYA